jgi:hypothetical protein
LPPEIYGDSLFLRQLPKRTYAAQGFDEFSQVFLHMRGVVGVQPLGEHPARKETDNRGQFVDALFGTRLKASPIADMLFRPEEIHGASGVGQIVEPLFEGNGGVSHDALWLCLLNRPVHHLHPDGSTAIQAGRIDPHAFSRKKPADRQRFEPSLGGPLLLAVDRDAVLGGDMAEGREGTDVIGARGQPAGKTR